MITKTVDAVSSSDPPITMVGLLATTGTISTGLYQQALEEKGISIATPTTREQDEVMDSIKKIKAGQHGARGQLVPIINRLVARGAKGLILGCTELSLVISKDDITSPLFDPLSILARHSVSLAKGFEN
jgi:aspartate racemase